MAGYKRLATILSIFVVGVFGINWVEARNDKETIVTVVFDREEDNELAVLLAEETLEEWAVNREQLPEESTPGEWFDIYLNESHIHHIELNKERTESEYDKIINLSRKLFE